MPLDLEREFWSGPFHPIVPPIIHQHQCFNSIQLGHSVALHSKSGLFVQPIKRRSIYPDSFITNYGFLLSFLCMWIVIEHSKMHCQSLFAFSFTIRVMASFHSNSTWCSIPYSCTFFCTPFSSISLHSSSHSQSRSLIHLHYPIKSTMHLHTPFSLHQHQLSL